MAVKKVQNELLIQYLIYSYSVQISILTFQHKKCKRMPPSGFQIIIWPAIVTSPCLWAVEGDEWGLCPDHACGLLRGMSGDGLNHSANVPRI